LRPEELRRKVVAALGALATPTARARALRAWGEIRRRPDAVLALVLGAGVLAMVLHWR
jgi:hypothetical protein